MEDLNQIISIISLTMGVAWASGINLYATILVLGLLSSTGNIELPPDLLLVENPIVLTTAGIMFFIEFFADKIPGIDTGWDSIQTFIRIPAGVILAAGAVGQINPALAVAAGILGGGITASTHAAKAGSRVLINTSPEPFTNWAASVTEDVAVITGLWIALHHPWIFLGLFVLFVLLLIWLLPKIWRGVKKVFGKLAALFSRKASEPALNIE